MQYSRRFIGLGLICHFLFVQSVLSAPNRVDWPNKAVSLVTNQTPIVVPGFVQDFLGATFHIEHFDPKTTVISGFIETTNHTDLTNSAKLYVRADAVRAHVEMRDMEDKTILDPHGTHYDWLVDLFRFAPHEVKRHRFKVELKRYFDLRPGAYQLLFVFNERLIRDVEEDRFTIRPWSSERVLLNCE